LAYLAVAENAEISHSVQLLNPQVSQENLKTIYLRFVGHILIDQLSSARLEVLCEELYKDVQFEIQHAQVLVESKEIAPEPEYQIASSISRIEMPGFHILEEE